MHCILIVDKFNHERWINEQQEAGKITKPIFYVWVEPYLAGGHILYIHPNDGKFDKYFNEDTTFKYNIISAQAYKNNTLFKIQEAGCNTSYTPYSMESVESFLAAIFPEICKTVKIENKKSYALSWIGDTGMISKMGIELSEIGTNNNPGSIIIY